MTWVRFERDGAAYIVTASFLEKPRRTVNPKVYLKRLYELCSEYGGRVEMKPVPGGSRWECIPRGEGNEGG